MSGVKKFMKITPFFLLWQKFLQYVKGFHFVKIRKCIFYNLKFFSSQLLELLLFQDEKILKCVKIMNGINDFPHCFVKKFLRNTLKIMKT